MILQQPKLRWSPLAEMCQPESRGALPIARAIIGETGDKEWDARATVELAHALVEVAAADGTNQDLIDWLSQPADEVQNSARAIAKIRLEILDPEGCADDRFSAIRMAEKLESFGPGILMMARVFKLGFAGGCDHV